MRHLSAAAPTWIGLVLVAGGAAVTIAVVQARQLDLRTEAAEPALWLLLVGACLAHAFPVIAPRHQAYHATQSFLIAAVLVLSWPWVVVIVAAAHVIEWLRRPRPLYIQLYNVAAYLVAAGAAAAVLHLAGGPSLVFADARGLIVALGAAAVLLLLNHGLTAVVLWLARGIRPADSGLFGSDSLGLDGTLLVVGVGMGGGLQLQPLSIVVTASPLILIYRALRVGTFESTSHRDHLSGLYNARHLTEALDVELRRANARTDPTGLLVAVLDDVPSIVRSFGRATLDFLMVAVAERLRPLSRDFDTVARLDEGTLGVLLPAMDVGQVEAAARRICEQVAAEPFGLPTTREAVAVSASVAYASLPGVARFDAADALTRVRDAATRAALTGPRVVIGVGVPPRVTAGVSDAAAPSVGAAATVATAWVPPRSWLRAFEATVIGCGLVLTLFVLARFSLPDAPLAAGILGLVVLSEMLAFELYDRSSFSVSFAPIVAAGLLGGPAATLLATWAVALTRGGIRRSAWHRVAFNGAAFTVTGVPAMVVATGAGTFAVDTSQFVPLVVGTAVASTIYYLHTFVVAMAIALDLGADPRQVWARNYRWLFPHFVILGWMGLGLALATVELGPLGTALFVAPPLAMRVVMKQYVERTAGAVQRLEAANADLRAASALLRQRGDELALLSDLGQLAVVEPALVVARCVPALGEACAMVWQASHVLEQNVHAEASDSGAATLIDAHTPEEVARLAEGVETGRVPDWALGIGGQWLAARLSAGEQRGWMLAWSSRRLAEEECARRLGLMHEVAQRVALVLERDALLEEAAELEALRSVDRAKSDFIATAAHELRTPLTSLQGYTELLRSPVDAALRDRWLGIVHVEAAQLGQVVDQLLDVSRLDQGRFHADRTELDLAQVIETVLAQFADQATLSGHAVTVQVSRHTRVFADAGQVERILRNLVSNALKYSPDGGPITVEATERSPGEVEVCVADRGLGIPSDWLDRLFERFQRVERPERASIRGTGLGLYIARQLVELNDGRIWATSAGVGQGSAFHFTLPTNE